VKPDPAVELRVAVDATPIATGRTGIARYVAQLCPALEQRGVGLGRFVIGRTAFAVPAGVRRLAVPLRVVEPVWRTLRWPPAERLVGGADLVHTMSLFVPPTRRPLVATVYDLAGLDFPELHPRRHVAQLRRQLASLARVDVVIAISQATADALARRGVDPARVVVAPLGTTPLTPREPTELDGSPAASLPRPPGTYLLAVGETSARKGYVSLLRALARTGADGPALVIVGPPAADEERVRATVHELGLARRVDRLGPVDDATLGRLYAGALALCYPSVAEGFGLPVLEALSMGVPVVASDIPVLRELAAEAALYAAPGDDDGLAVALAAVAGDASRRARLIAAGRARAAAFTWDRTAELTVAAYHRALAMR
jgi:glycosyltransferase involved in cell wall biosynthesis